MNINEAMYQQIHDAIMFTFSKVPELKYESIDNLDSFINSCNILWNTMNQYKLDYEASLIQEETNN